MHQPMKNGLEDYLAGKTGLPREFTAHLESCAECAAEAAEMREQSLLFGALRTEVEPRAGFYARVLDRIEQQALPSIWSMMLEPAFGRSIAVACAALTIVVGTYLFTTETHGQFHRPAVVRTQDIAQQENSPIQQQDRDAVLVSLASFQEN